MVSIVFVAALTRVLPGYLGFMRVNQDETAVVTTMEVFLLRTSSVSEQACRRTLPLISA
jgi:hypothetical protein